MPRSNRSRDSNSRRSRSSSGRSRSRNHRDSSRHGSRDREHSSRGHSTSSHRHHVRIKHKEKNFLAALCSMVTIVVLSTALAEPKWVYLRGGGCSVNGRELNYLGAYQFFYPGRFLVEKDVTDGSVRHMTYQFGSSETEDKMDNCVTYKSVMLLKTIIALSFLAILFSLAAFVLDLIGPSQRGLKLLRRNGIFSIVTVVTCVVINLSCYWLTTEVESLQRDSRQHPGSKIVVTFYGSFYLVTAAGAVGVIATACNCLKRYPVYDDSDAEAALLDDYDGMDASILPPGPDVAPLTPMPPPPAYTP